MSEDRILRVAIASDLHTFEPADAGGNTHEPSFYSTHTEELNAAKNPIQGLKCYIRENDLHADILLCPGDLGDKASPAGILKGWRAINDIASELSADLVLGTVGNHDVDSRGKFNNYDPRGYLQTIEPLFPTNDNAQNDHFWSRHYSVVKYNQHCRIVIVNSSAFHGYESEKNHGRISQYCIERLRTDLKSEPTPAINILLCHHHPHKHADMPLDEEYDAIDGGSSLLDMLDKSNCGQWLVIHGHKHMPSLCYPASQNSTSIVFSAGSLCAKLQNAQTTLARNQFYILEFCLDTIARLGLVGKFTSWTWSVGLGWQPTQDRLTIPHKGGFGLRPSFRQLANKVKSTLVENQVVSWDSIENNFEELRFVLPSSLKLFLQELKLAGVDSEDTDGMPLQVFLKANI